MRAEFTTRAIRSALRRRPRRAAIVGAPSSTSVFRGLDERAIAQCGARHNPNRPLGRLLWFILRCNGAQVMELLRQCLDPKEMRSLLV